MLLPDSCQVHELLVLSRDTGQCLYNARSKSAGSLDESIFSAFISAVYNFSQELGSEKLERMRMGEKALFLVTYSGFIFVMDAAEEADEAYLLELHGKLSREFIETVNKYDLDPERITFQSDLKSTGFEETLLAIIEQVKSQYLVETPQERFHKVEQQLISILGRSLGEHAAEEAKTTAKIRKVETGDDLAKFFEGLEISLTKRINRIQAKQLVKKLKKGNEVGEI
ncbi:MAG: hypothetical protein ACFFD4_36675 [Candidatus Odinarchaeota archaeon]